MRTSNPMLAVAGVISFMCLLIGFDAAADDSETKAKVTGIGGVFFLSHGKGKDLSAWYEEHLGMKLEDFGGAVLQWEQDTAEDDGLTVWGIADQDSEWFRPSESAFMINYRVDDLEKMIEQLTNAGIEILGGPEYHENGIFAWIMDPDGNKIELWQPMLWDEKNKK
jgi:predicted enzyme related to lactoylglutathione lyase